MIVLLRQIPWKSTDLFGNADEHVRKVIRSLALNGCN